MRIEGLEIGEQWGLVLTPRSHIRLGRDRLNALRGTPSLSELDLRILNAIRSGPRPATFIVLRGSSDDGKGSWGFEEGMSRGDLEELGYLMVSSQLLTWRTLATAGVTLFLKVEWGAREIDAIGAGTHRLYGELCDAASVERDAGRKALLELDAWVARFLSFWLLTSFGECKDSFLPRTLKRTAKRGDTLRSLIEKVPKGLL